MKVIKSVSITDAMLVSSTVPEPDTGEVAWSAATNYTLGTTVYRATTHRRYQNLIAGVDATVPENAPTRWQDIGPTNRWAMFDEVVGTSSTDTSMLTAVIAPGIVNSIALLELKGRTLTVSMDYEGDEVYSRIVNLEGSEVDDWYEYFFAEFEQRSEVVLTDLPPYMDGEITVQLEGAGTVSIGVLVVGTAHEIGDTQHGAGAQILDFSKKEVDPTFGTTKLLQRTFSKQLTLPLWLANGRVNRVFRLMAGLRASFCVWVGSEEAELGVLVAYGFYTDFSVQIAYPAVSLINLQIEGVI